MLYMVIEKYRQGDPIPVYRRFHERGRLMPEGLRYVDSWVTRDFARCFQLVESNDPEPLERWMEAWSDLVEFEVVSVVTSSEASEAVRSRLR